MTEAGRQTRDSAPQAREELGRMLREQHYAVLASDCAGQPQTNIVAFLSADDLKSIVFFTPRASQKFLNMLVNPLISLFIDNRTNGTADVFRATGISIQGKSRALEENEREAWRARYIEKHPGLADFAAAPENVMISLDVYRYVIVNQFQMVTVFVPEA
jgi:heme iron utilization protein